MGRDRVEKPRGFDVGQAVMVHLRPRRVFAKVDHGRFLAPGLCTLVHQEAFPKIPEGQRKTEKNKPVLDRGGSGSLHEGANWQCWLRRPAACSCPGYRDRTMSRDRPDRWITSN